MRNDLITTDPGPARAFYCSVFGFTLDGNPALSGLDFTFLRRPDGHEIGGIIGAPDASASAWNTTFEVTDVDATIATAIGLGGASGPAEDFPYGRMATLKDPFGAEFSVVARPRA